MTQEGGHTSPSQPLTTLELQALLSQVTYDPDRLRSLQATADYLSTTKGAVQGLIKRGTLKSLRIGNADYVAQSAIHEWIEKEHKRQDRDNYRREVMTAGVDPEIQKALSPKKQVKP